MSTTYFGFSMSDRMFQALGDCDAQRRVLTAQGVKKIVEAGVVSCINESHQATIDAMKSRYGIIVDVPAKPPLIDLKVGDQLVVMGVQGLPRLPADRKEYTEEEIKGAGFTFSVWIVKSKAP